MGVNHAANLSGTAGDVSTMFFGSVSGGLSAELSGGNFWQGAATGFIVSTLNHVAHRFELNREINSGLKELGYELKGDPPYEYNGQSYDNKGSLYGAILVDQFAEQFGIKDIVALAAALDGTFPSIDKPFTTPGSSSKTSYASKYGAKILPQKMPTKLPTHINPNTGKMAYTKVLGRFLGRVAGPIGWGLLAYDVGKALYDTQIIYNRITN